MVVFFICFMIHDVGSHNTHKYIFYCMYRRTCMTPGTTYGSVRKFFLLIHFTHVSIYHFLILILITHIYHDSCSLAVFLSSSPSLSWHFGVRTLIHDTHASYSGELRT